MVDILLVAVNAKYIHTSLAVRYLYANLGPLQNSAKFLEFVINESAHDIVEAILQERPRILGFSVYLWNYEIIKRILQLLKILDPEHTITIVLGGPEVSHEPIPLLDLTDFVITDEGEKSFLQLCQTLLATQTTTTTKASLPKIIKGEKPLLTELQSPYAFYTAEDLAQRIIYIEASRGCNFKCDFCLSSLSKNIRTFPLTTLLPELAKLLLRGARNFKFIDRSFNVSLTHAQEILQFFLENYQPELFIHLEMVPEYLPESLLHLLAKFPRGALQLEIGIQTFNPVVAQTIQRPLTHTKLIEHLNLLKHETAVHLHTDLLIGLPGEDLTSIANSFNELVALKPHEIQLGILKLLRGAPLARHNNRYQMHYNPLPPYELLANALLDFPTMQQLKRLARFWDLVANRGYFKHTLPWLWHQETPFAGMWRFSAWLYKTTKQTHSIALARLSRLIATYLLSEKNLDPKLVEELLTKDQNLYYQQKNASQSREPIAQNSYNKRQSRHQELRLD